MSLSATIVCVHGARVVDSVDEFIHWNCNDICSLGEFLLPWRGRENGTVLSKKMAKFVLIFFISCWLFFFFWMLLLMLLLSETSLFFWNFFLSQKLCKSHKSCQIANEWSFFLKKFNLNFFCQQTVDKNLWIFLDQIIIIIVLYEMNRVEIICTARPFYRGLQWFTAHESSRDSIPRRCLNVKMTSRRI